MVTLGLRKGLIMTMTPDRHAIHAKYAPEHGLGRQGSVYDRLWTEWQAAGRTVPGGTWDGAGRPRRRPSPQVRPEIPEDARGPLPLSGPWWGSGPYAPRP